MKLRVAQAVAALAIAFQTNVGLAGEDPVLASFHRMLEDQRVAFDALRRPTPSVEAFDPFKRSIVRSEPSRFELQDLSFRRMLEDQRLAFDEIRPRAMSVAEYYGKVTPESQAMMSR